MANISAGLIPDHLLTRMDQELSPDNPLNRDVRDLAGLLGFTNDEISYICMKRHAFKYMLDQWSKRDCVNSTLENLKTSLLELKRLDVVELVDEAVTEINNASYDRLEELVVLQNEREDNASGFASLTVSAQTYSDDTSSVEVEKKISVFIVYYPENEEYMQSVHELVAFLHESYIDVKVDLYDALRNSQSLPLFALSNLRNCDFVLVLCSESVKYSEQLLNNKAVELSEKMKELVFIMKQIIGDLYRRMQPEAIVIIIDVSQSMAVASEGEKTPLEKCITAANMIVQRKIFSDMKKNKDEAALILFGTNGTENSLNGANGGYEHVTLAQPLGIMDLALLKFINEQITAGDALGDFIDAVVVALDHLHTKCLGRKMEQKIILFSNVHCEFGEDQLDTIIGGMKANDVNFIFVGPEVDDDDNDKPRPGPSSRTDQGRASGKQLTQQQIIGLKCIRHILDEVDGEGMSLSEVLPLLSFFETRRRKQVPAFRGAIEIGANLKINATAFVKTSEERPSPWHKLSALAESAATRDTMDVVRETTYFLNDEDQTEVEQENTAQAYRYGKTLVPMTKDDQKSMKLETTRGCVVLGFTSRDNIDRHLFSRNGCHIFVPQPEDEHATVAFSALCHALAEKEMVAIVRYVSRSGNDPKIGFLAPHIKHSYESLIFVALPYREDLRQYFFPSLEGEGIFPPSEEQLAAVDGLIDTMSLVRTEVIDGENIHEELYKPRNILNPVNQRECQCIQSRALNPEENRIPEIEEYIQRSITVVPEIATNCRMSSETVKAKFKLEVNEQKKAVKNVFRREKQEEKDESDSKKSKINDDDNEANEFSLASLNRNQVTEVGTVDPVNDFKRLVQNANLENFAKIGMQMSDRILRLVLDSFIDQYYAKAIQCLTVLKEECLKRKQSCVFNKLLLSIKDAAYRKRRHDFWELIAKEQITPISKDNDPESDYTCDQSKQFYEDEIEERADKLVDAVIEDENELLDMM